MSQIPNLSLILETEKATFFSSDGFLGKIVFDQRTAQKNVQNNNSYDFSQMN